MSAKRDGFTIHDLEELSGFDRRTIAYYSQEGLLPKVGRRGRGTVYPAAFKERLMFIRAVRDLQDAGSLRAVTLAEIKIVMADMDTEEILRLQKSASADEAIRGLFDDPDWDTRGIAVPVEVVVREESKHRSRTAKPETFADSALSSSTPSPTESRQAMRKGSITQLIQQIEDLATQSEGKGKGNTAETSISQQSIAKLSAHISITVTDLGEDQEDLLLQLIEQLRESF